MGEQQQPEQVANTVFALMAGGNASVLAPAGMDLQEIVVMRDDHARLAEREGQMLGIVGAAQLCVISRRNINTMLS
jgi:hypothetical protein